jgi:hypothetical protein
MTIKLGSIIPLWILISLFFPLPSIYGLVIPKGSSVQVGHLKRRSDSVQLIPPYSETNSTSLSSLDKRAYTENPIDSSLRNSFANGTDADSSPTCAEARNQVSRDQQVTKCFGTDTELFFATLQTICTSDCLSVTIRAAKLIAKSCAQPASSDAQFSKGNVYAVRVNSYYRRFS